MPQSVDLRAAVKGISGGFVHVSHGLIHEFRYSQLLCMENVTRISSMLFIFQSSSSMFASGYGIQSFPDYRSGTAAGAVPGPNRISRTVSRA
jgi:hypothetical protein